MAGSASTNGMLFAIATWLVLAWRNAGWIGLDRWLLPALGTPWRPGYFFDGHRKNGTAKGFSGVKYLRRQSLRMPQSRISDKLELLRPV